MSADAAAYREGTDLTLSLTGVAAMAIDRSAKRARAGGVMRAGRTGKTLDVEKEVCWMGRVNHVCWQTKRARIDKVRRVWVRATAPSQSCVSSPGLARQDSFPVLRRGDEVCWRGPRATGASKLGGAGVLDAVSQEGRE
jgi:hypothetical protein